MQGDSIFDSRDIISIPPLKFIKEKEGGTCLCYQMRIHGKLHFVKKIKPEFKNDARMRAAFRKENEIGYSLDYPSLPRYVFIEGVFSPEEYVVTEWIDGVNLDEFIATHQDYFRDRARLNELILTLAKTVDYLHAHGICHGDIKPSNIIISQGGKHVYLIDLGFASTGAHDLTSGFSPGFSLSSTCQTDENDYFSLGKVVEFICDKTGIPANRRLYRLADILQGKSEERNIQSAEEISRYLDRNKKLWLYSGAALSLIILALFLGVTVREGENQAENVTWPEVKEGNDRSSEPIEATGGHLLYDESFMKEEEAKVRAEIKDDMDLQNKVLLAMVDSLFNRKIFTNEAYYSLLDEYSASIGRLKNISYHRSRHPVLSYERIMEIFDEEMERFIEVRIKKIDSYYKFIY